MNEILIYGAVTSSVYAMLAVGFTLIFGVARTLNLAHGSFYALGAYGTYLMTTSFKLSLTVAAALAVLIVAALGVAMERMLIRPLRGAGLAVPMMTLAMALVVEQVLFLGFGSEYRNVPSFIAASVIVGGVDVSGQRLLTVAVSWCVLAFLWVFVYRTRQGSAILALSQDREAAQYVGIPVDRIYALVTGISAALAATAGVLIAPFLTVQPGMGLMPMIKAFSIVIVGGLGSVRGSIVAALLLGYAETIVAYEISASWTELVSLVAVFMTLVLRPAGLFGIRAR
ncbi:branched-chain amino acid ABC transporter permease [Paraburkholderia sp. MM5477-R1]|uniref:branched-chain amino acid ABC transporter permease n=1 Tax=Paraburkholderia sp. MM5477-R1 TaxID=2991062 RepID=UPI003D1D9048